MKSKLYIIEGLPCSGKSATSAFVAELLSENKKVCFVDEGTGNHLADYEFHSFLSEDMMRFGFDVEKSLEHISEIARIVEPMEPVVIYLKNTDIRASVEKAAKEREGWLDAVIDYHVNGEFGKSINAGGFDGYIRCLEERQERELEILSKLNVRNFVIDNPQSNWEKTYNGIKEFIK